MIPTDVAKVVNILETMEQHELTLAALYETCAETWEKDDGFWLALAQAEKSHGGNMRRMSSILREKPDQFTLGRPFNLTALSTALSGIRENIAHIRADRYSQAKALFIARDIEQSILESKYAELVTAKDMEYQNLMSDIFAQTRMHKDMIQKRISAGAAP